MEQSIDFVEFSLLDVVKTVIVEDSEEVIKVDKVVSPVTIVNGISLLVKMVGNVGGGV